MQASSTCAFCSQPISASDHKHQCTEQLYALINKIIQSKDNNSPALFNNITNLVFQGGGVKGVAYIGVLEQLQSEAKKSGRDFLGGVQRIAGTSAGSIVALYLGLNMDVEKDISPLMQQGYEKLLDDGLVLKVKLDKSFWSFGPDHKNFKAKHIILKALKYFDELNKTLESENAKLKEEAQKTLQEAVNKVFRYYGGKLGFIPSLAIKIKGSNYASDVVQWLFDLLDPPKKAEPAKVEVQVETSVVSEESVKQSSNPANNSSTDGAVYAESTGVSVTSPRKHKQKHKRTRFKHIIKEECSGKLSESDKLEIHRAENPTEQASQNPTSPDQTNPTGKEVDIENVVVKSQIADETVKKTAILPEEPCLVEEQNVIKAKEDDAKEYIERNQRKIIAAAPEEELTWDLLPTALGELLWFIVISQQNAAGVQEQLGVFDGSEVKKELIEKPIIDRLLKLNLAPKSDLTFKELMDYNADLPEGQKFKQFYVTAFNTETSQTEVFSAEHTPNVVIADAVRASMSIPVFFSPVTIREKDASSGVLQEKTYFNGVQTNVVHYMDGGILDNFPLWIFDDFKYCFGEDFKCGPNMKFSIQNPDTLGFRLLDTDTIEKYTNPRFIGKEVTGEEKTKEYKEKFSYQMGLLLNAVANEAQENEIMKRGDYTRSVYVDNKGVSAIAFSLGDNQREALIESGRQSIRDYQERANKNFNGEGPLN